MLSRRLTLQNEAFSSMKPEMCAPPPSVRRARLSGQLSKMRNRLPGMMRRDVSATETERGVGE